MSQGTDKEEQRTATWEKEMKAKQFTQVRHKECQKKNKNGKFSRLRTKTW